MPRNEGEGCAEVSRIPFDTGIINHQTYSSSLSAWMDKDQSEFYENSPEL